VSDINTYALSLSLNLQDNATEVLRGAVNVLNELETKVASVQRKLDAFGATGESAGSRIAQQFQRALDVLGGQPAAVDRASRSYRDMAGQAARAGQAQVDAVQQAQETMVAAQRSGGGGAETAEKNLKKFGKTNTGFQKDQNKNEKKQTKFQVMWRKFYGFMEKQNKGRLKIGKKGLKQDDERVKDIEEQVLQGGKFVKTMRVGSVVAGGMSAVFKKMGGLVDHVKSGLRKGLDVVGMGKLGELLSLTGLYKVGIMEAMQQEEAFHLIQFRGIGTMRGLASEIRVMTAKGMPLLSKEVTAATTSLTMFGNSRDRVMKLRMGVASLNRTTGASTDAIARMVKTMDAMVVTAGGSVDKLDLATKSMVEMQTAAKDLQLTSAEIDQLMVKLAQDSIFMGSSGVVQMARWNKTVMAGVAAAKKLGINTGEVQQVTDRAFDTEEAIKFSKILGSQVSQSKMMNMTIQERMTVMQNAAKAMLKEFKARKAAGQSTIDLEARIKAATGSSVAGGIKQLRLLSTMTEKGIQDAVNGISKAPDHTKAATDKLKEGAKDTENTYRKLALTVGQAVAKVQISLQGVQDEVGKLVEMLRKSGFMDIFGDWRIIAVAAAGAIIGGLSSLFGIASTVFSLFGIFAETVLPVVAEAVMGVVGAVGAAGLTGVLVVAGEAIALIGAAFIGWKIGKWIDKITGIGKAFTWLGSKAVKAYRWVKNLFSAEGEQDRHAIKMRKKFAAVEKNATEKKIAQLKKSLAGKDIKERRKVAAQIDKLTAEMSAREAKQHKAVAAANKERAKGASAEARIGKEVKKSHVATVGSAKAEQKRAKAVADVHKKTVDAAKAEQKRAKVASAANVEKKKKGTASSVLSKFLAKHAGRTGTGMVANSDGKVLAGLGEINKGLASIDGRLARIESSIVGHAVHPAVGARIGKAVRTAMAPGRSARRVTRRKPTVARGPRVGLSKAMGIMRAASGLVKGFTGQKGATEDVAAARRAALKRAYQVEQAKRIPLEPIKGSLSRVASLFGGGPRSRAVPMKTALVGNEEMEKPGGKPGETQLRLLTEQNEMLARIGERMPDGRELMKWLGASAEHLSEIKEKGNKGLAPSANQWT